MAESKSIGALWKPKSDNPKAPMAKGVIEVDGKKINIVIWPNYKQQEKQPDYRICIDEPREPSAQKPASGLNDESIPF